MHTLQPKHPTIEGDSTVLQIKLSEQGRIVVLSNVPNQDSVCNANTIEEEHRSYLKN